MSSALESIRKLSEALFQYSNIDDMVRQVLQTALEVIGEDAGSILLADPKNKQLVFRCVIGESSDVLFGTAIPWDKGIAGAVFFSGQPEIIPVVQEDPRHYSLTDRITGYNSLNMIAVPMKRHGGEPIGVIEVLNKTSGPISRDDLDVLIVIASLGATAIEQNNTAESLRQKDLQLQQSQKMESMGRLAAGVAHDFNNLLTVIRMSSELIALEPNAPMQENTEQILKAVDKASHLTRQLLTFSQKQVGEVQLVNLNGLISNIESLVRQLIGKDIRFISHLPPELGWVKADPRQIDQVVMNLAVNARDAMPEGGTLTIETANVEINSNLPSCSGDISPGPYIILSVADTGCGIDEETQRKMFEPFFTTKGPTKGTGLGLSIIYGIMKQNHGYVSVSSAVRRGTTFTIYLPHVEAAVVPSSSCMGLPTAA